MPEEVQVTEVRPMTQEQWNEVLDDREDRTFIAHEKWITEKFSKHAAEHANYGWAVDYVDRTYSTKVYGYGILTTNMETMTHTFEHIIE